MIRLQRELEAIRARELPRNPDISGSLFGTSTELSASEVYDADSTVILDYHLRRIAFAFAEDCLVKKVRQCVQLEQSGDGARLFIKLCVLTPEEVRKHFRAATLYQEMARELEVTQEQLSLAKRKLDRARRKLNDR